MSNRRSSDPFSPSSSCGVRAIVLVGLLLSTSCSLLSPRPDGSRATSVSDSMLSRYRGILERYELDGDPAETETALKELIDEEPRFIEAHRSLQDLLIEDGRRAEANELYEDWAQAEPENAVALFLLARLKESPEGQDELLRRASELEPNLIWLPFARAHRARGSGLLREAVEILEETVVRDPSFLEAWLKLADLYESLGNWDRALLAYDRVLEMIPWDLETNLRRAQVLIELGQPREAEKSLVALHSSHPEDPYPAFYLGIAAWKREKYDRAVSWLRKAIEIDPDQPDAYYNLGILYEDALDQPEQALMAYRLYLDKGGEQTIRIQTWIDRLNREGVAEGEGRIP